MDRLNVDYYFMSDARPPTSATLPLPSLATSSSSISAGGGGGAGAGAGAGAGGLERPVGSPWLPLGMGMGMGMGEPLRVGSLSVFYEDERTRHMPSLQPYPRPDATFHFAPRALHAPHHIPATATATTSASASASGADNCAPRQEQPSNTTAGTVAGSGVTGAGAGDGEDGTAMLPLAGHPHSTSGGAGVGGGGVGGARMGISSPMLGVGMTSPMLAVRTPALNPSTRLFQSPTFSSPT